ncbi:hypothetical protein NQ314_004432, partial [Rhamnusium bicolor]
MNINIIFKDFPNICRLCLCTGTLQPIMQIKVLNVFSTITNIHVKEEDKLPENVCNNCVKQLEDISTFIDRCKDNDETLRTIVLKEYESLTVTLEKADVYDDDPYDDDDVKSENDNSDNNYFSDGVKEEIVTEPDITDINLNNEEGP